MQENINGSYYAVRASQEHALAEKATDAGIRKIHVAMAAHYEVLSLGDVPPNSSR